MLLSSSQQRIARLGSAFLIPALISDLGQLVDVFAGYEHELAYSSCFTALKIGSVLIALIKSFCGNFRRPLDDQECMRKLPLTLKLFNVRCAGQVTASVALNHRRHVLDI